MKQTILLFIFSITLFSCNKEENKSEVLENNSSFDLEKINFNENVFQLFSKNLVGQDGLKLDSITKNSFSDSIYDYKIENYLADEFKLKLPKKELGFLYKTSQTDSVAVLDNAFCERLWTLTNLNKKPIAYYAVARLNTNIGH